MSMKRTKTKSSGRAGSEVSFGGFGKGKDKEPTWADAVSQKADDMFIPHAMTTHFLCGSLISHTVFGKGLVLSVDGAKIEVLFEDGKKKLAHALR
jgi:hypothetical protein